MNTPISEIQFTEIPGRDGTIGLITLNRPQVLNALNHAMFIALNKQLTEWEKQRSLKAVVIEAAPGRAFCAGGDVRHVYENKLTDSAILAKFFRDEYRMNLQLYHFSKPYIALLNGITMGGGAGISIHGSHRIATENLKFAMPETAIGFFPDVGMTYQLARLPHKIGFYLGLTGARIIASDCLALGLVQEIVAMDALPMIIETLVNNALPNKKAVTTLLKPFAQAAPKSPLMEHVVEIEACFSENTIENILKALEQRQTTWCDAVVNSIKSKSPSSLKVTLEALKKAEKLNFDASMQMEYGLASQFILHHDFFEGVRAVLVDKDQKPQWQPARLTDVSTQEIANYFAPSANELV